MGGGLMQLVAYGAQDIYLTGNPQITFFKVVYRRHTNFSMESIEQTFNGSTAAGGRATATISRNGDLVHRMYLEMPTTITVDVGSGPFAGANPGHTLIDNVECEIGGQRIDRHYSHWMEAWTELTEPNSAGVLGLCSSGDVAGDIVNTGTKIQNLAKAGGVTANHHVDGEPSGAAITPVVPLQFWFCRNPGLALPLIALQYHEVKIIVTFAAAVTGLARTDGTAKLYADYIYLDTDERRRFAQVSHEYLIEQVQHQSASGSAGVTLNFNHPVKELIFQGATATGAGGGVRTAFTGTPSSGILLKLNGHDRFTARPLSYFTQTQVWEHHTGTPVKSTAAAATVANGVGQASVDEIGVYSFSLKPEEHQPSGTCNFSRIDSAQLQLTNGTLLDTGINVYAVNYNVLRIMSGMGGLAYSN